MQERIFLVMTTLFFAVSITSIVSGDVYEDIILADSPTLYWRLGEPSGATALNLGSLGSAANGVYGSNVNYGLAGLAPSTSNTAIEFSQDVNSRVLLDPFSIPSTDVSVSFWVNGQDTGLTHFFGYAGGSGGDPNEFTFGANNGSFRTIVRSSIVDFGGVDVLDGTSHHVGISWTNSSGLLSVYVDGALADSRTVAAGQTLAGNGALALGQDFDSRNAPYGFSASQAFEGTLDEFAIFDQVLTQSQFADHFTAVPEPASVMLLGCASLWMLTRRRR